MSTGTISLTTAAPIRPHRFWRWLLGIIAIAILGVLVNLFLLFPWMSTWGATREERQSPLPGDDLVPNANIQTTKGLAIEAGPEDIYLWLLQIGVDRGGMYSYDWLENLFGLNVHTVDAIVPEYQNAQVGDF